VHKSQKNQINLHRLISTSRYLLVSFLSIRFILIFISRKVVEPRYTRKIKNKSLPLTSRVKVTRGGFRAWTSLGLGTPLNPEKFISPLTLCKIIKLFIWPSGPSGPDAQPLSSVLILRIPKKKKKCVAESLIASSAPLSLPLFRRDARSRRSDARHGLKPLPPTGRLPPTDR
jgi:hypothetical protein